MKVEVAYARPDVQVVLAVEVPDGATAEQAVRASGILARFAEIDLAANPVGIFSQPCALGRALRPGDRVEIYRPLQADPKQARRGRAGAAGRPAARRPPPR
jgi:putative ubiquitin-RnfH superfamily antitoxin RatB of RatAB toxin-antitoxin module